MKAIRPSLIPLLIFLLSLFSASLNNTWAAIVPAKIETAVSNKKAVVTKKKAFKKSHLKNRKMLKYAQKSKRATKKSYKRYKKHPNKIQDDPTKFSWGWISISWYALFTGLLIIGIVLSIPFIWIAALIMLLLPLILIIILFAVLIFGFDGGSLC